MSIATRLIRDLSLAGLVLVSAAAHAPRAHADVHAPLDILKLNTGTVSSEINYITEGDALNYGIAILDRQTGNPVLPDNIDRRTRKGEQ